jgi:hypothetical protein
MVGPYHKPILRKTINFTAGKEGSRGVDERLEQARSIQGINGEVENEKTSRTNRRFLIENWISFS